MEMNLKAARENANLSRKQVCEILDMHLNTISSYELYKTSPDIDTATQLATLYGCGVNDIKWSK